MMNKYKMMTMILALYVALLSDAFASEIKVINSTDHNIHIFFRGSENQKHPYVKTITARDNASFQILDEHIDAQPVFQAIASTERRGNPDWKLLAGTCDQLHKDMDYTLLIEKTKMGLKTSCTALPLSK